MCLNTSQYIVLATHSSFISRHLLTKVNKRINGIGDNVWVHTHGVNVEIEFKMDWCKKV